MCLAGGAEVLPWLDTLEKGGWLFAIPSGKMKVAGALFIEFYNPDPSLGPPQAKRKKIGVGMLYVVIIVRIWM